MSCCNHRRARLAAAAPRLAPARTPPPAATPAAAPTPAAPPAAGRARPEQPGPAGVPLRFTGSRPVRVEGVASGRIYRAGPAAPAITARPEDVRSLLRSGLFARVPPR
jgi:hypothetical protein